MSINTEAVEKQLELKHELRKLAQYLKSCQKIADEMIDPITGGSHSWKERYVRDVYKLQDKLKECERDVQGFLKY